MISMGWHFLSMFQGKTPYDFAAVKGEYDNVEIKMKKEQVMDFLKVHILFWLPIYKFYKTSFKVWCRKISTHWQYKLGTKSYIFFIEAILFFLSWMNNWISVWRSLKHSLVVRSPILEPVISTNCFHWSY